MWILARTRAMRERWVAATLLELDPPIVTYIPVARRFVRPHHCRRKKLVEKPAFGTYIFASLDELSEWRRMQDLARPVRVKDRIAVVDDKVIDEVRSMEARGAFNEVRHDQAFGIRIGDQVIIGAPFFEGTIGRVTRVFPRAPRSRYEVELPNAWRIGVAEIVLVEASG